MVARNAVNVLVLVRVQVGEFDSFVAQLAEHLAVNQGVVGSSPTVGAC